MSEDKVSFDDREQEFFVPRQVLLTGPEDEFQRLIDSAQVPLRPVYDDPDRPSQFNLGSLHEALKDCQKLPGYLLELWGRGCLDREWAIALFRIVDETQVVDAVAKINEVSRQLDLCTGAGPNYLTGYPYTIAGSPYTIAGSPYTIAGSPYTIAGSPTEMPEEPLQPEDFRTQWAFERIGLISAGTRTTRHTGKGVRVGVFDTSPFKEEEAPPLIDSVRPTPSLTLHHPTAFEQHPPSAFPGARQPPDVLKSHGLSVVSLVYAVAPSSDIHLYRVLDEHCRGNLFVLSSAIAEFLREFINTPPRHGGVINLSLGIRMPSNWQELGLPEDVLALDLVLALAHCQGLAVVAAAGNGSAERPDAAGAERPAHLGFVIGVAASNCDKERACFSNVGDLAAPGGDGYPGDEPCESPWAHQLVDRLKYGLLCPVLPSEQYPDGLALWTGTSFSAPLVSGLAALILEDQAGALPAAVPDLIAAQPPVPADNALGAGIIDVPGSLQP
jgi:subtilisin family serine protease